MPDVNKEFEFLLAMVKTGNLSVDYDAAGALLGWNKKKCVNKMSEFRKLHDWPINKDAPAVTKGTKVTAIKRAANDDDGEGDAAPEAQAKTAPVTKKPTVKRAKTKAAKNGGGAADEDNGEGAGEVKKPAKKAPAKPRAKGKKAAKEVIVTKEKFAMEENGEGEGFDA